MDSTQCSKEIFLTGGGARTSTGGGVAPLPHAGYAPETHSNVRVGERRIRVEDALRSAHIRARQNHYWRAGLSDEHLLRVKVTDLRSFM